MTDETIVRSTRQNLQIDVAYSPLVNYAMQQNHVPVIRRFLIQNKGQETLQDLTLQITSIPEYSHPYEKKLALLPAGSELDAGLIDLQLQAAFLAGLTERLTGELQISLLDTAGAVLLTQNKPLTLLAFDEWSGGEVLPEMLCAFVMPNHPALAPLLHQAAELLQQWTGDPSLDGYQSKDPNRVRRQIAALYGALQARQIVYVLPPASFEQKGQRVRLVDQVLEQKLGTCLDLTLLYASCLEAVGLNPLLIIIKGHAFVGAWLEESCFPETLQDDVSLLAKKTAAGIQDLLLVETTALVAGKIVPFDEAEKMALLHLRREDDFICLIDVRRARASGIRPLPQRIMTPAGWMIQAAAGDEKTDWQPDAPADLDNQPRIQDVQAIPMTRQKQWERKLLDLSLRNTLLNFRLTKGTVRLFARQLAHLEDLLSGGADFQILERPADWLEDARDPRAFENQFNLDPYEQLLEFEFRQKRLRTPLPAADLLQAVTSLYRNARSSLEENGANTLYLALGFLRWYETEASQQPRYAPLVLIPVDLVRRSVSKGFIIRSRDEEPQVNITLLELLRQDFGLTIGGLDPLPRDENGVDVKAVLNVFRQAVLQRARWTVMDEAFLGIFSFTQFIMWYDIRNRADDLAKNRTVASLMAGRLTWQPDELLPAGLDLDDLYRPERTFLPISADASQLAAVYAAGEGRSFVLHGPPGTGKSQTITNIIANTLARGKTVLFVAEKMAALTVVQRRLAAIGLGPFCLELHSNKSRKKDVLEQLRLATEIARTGPPEGFGRQAEQLQSLRQELGLYVRQLYRVYPFGFSLFDAISRYGELTDAAAGVSFDPALFAALERDQVDNWFGLAGELQAAARDTGGIAGHPLAEIRLSQWTQSARSAAAALLPRYIDALQAASGQMVRLRSLLQIEAAPAQAPAAAEGVRLYELCRQALALPALPAVLLTAADLPALAVSLQLLAAQGQDMTASHQALLAIFNDSVLDQAGEPLLNDWRQSSAKWLLPRLIGQGGLVGRLKPHLRPGSRLQTAQVEPLLQHLARYQTARRQTALLLNQLPGQLAGYWQDLTTDWLTAGRYAAQLPELNQILLQVSGDRQTAATLAGRLSMILENPADRLKLSDYLQAFERQAEQQEQTTALLGVRFDQIAADSGQVDNNGQAGETGQAMQAGGTGQVGACQSWFDRLLPLVGNWLAHLDQLREWCIWRAVRDQACAAGLEALVVPVEQGVLDPADIPDGFARAFYQAAAAWIIAGDPVLNSFSGPLFEEKIRRFKQRNDQFEELIRQEIFARLAARIPQMAVEAAASSELGILQRAIKSNGRALSIRRLFELIPNLLPRLSPCMLMSPISVAQYLDPKQPPFDLVIFDEASQMPTSEAVGAIARGRDVVVVGDPRQLPPTSFFAINSTDEENFETEDLESVLDDCLALSMPSMHLLWHYRSRHESLIAFSNRQYYENKLLTFPSPNDLVSRVRLIPVDGVYDRGRSKQNRIEAEAVVAEIARRLADPVLCRQSIGVVTFSSIQQNLIEDLLTELFRERPDLEEKATQGLEPVFIKNLENVQGDERDVILFSIGYGPDKNGRVSLNFGPLNRDGGWRRLNVAVSRARCDMMVFSTIQPEQLDVTRTGALGVAGLKAFLEYARRGYQGLPLIAGQEAPPASARPTQSASAAVTPTPAPAAAQQTGAGLAAQVAAALEENGYPTQLMIGSSGYRIDIGVIHPERAGQYMLGILCNGSTYRDARTTRDREILQMSVLRQLGWQLHQIWAVDWWENPAKETRRLLQRLELLRRQPEPAGQAPEAGQFNAGGSAGGQPTEMTAVEPVADSGDSSADQAGSQAESRPDAAPIARQVVAGASGRPAGLDPADLPTPQPYPVAALAETTLDLEGFLLPKNKNLIVGKLKAIIRTEAPISRLLLYRRLLQSCGINRISPRIELLLDQLMTAIDIQKIRHQDHVFFWLPAQNPAGWLSWRPAGDEAGRRLPEDLPPEELAAVVRHVLRQQIGLPRPDLLKESARLMGYARMGSALERVFRQAVDLALERGWASASPDHGDYLSEGPNIGQN